MGTQEAIAEEVGVDDALYIRYSIDNRAAIITIDHPPANAFNSQVIEELTDALETLEEQDTLRMVILRGAGKSFSAGADLKLFADGDPKTAGDMARYFGEAFETLSDFRGVSIAAINGFALAD